MPLPALEATIRWGTAHKNTEPIAVGGTESTLLNHNQGSNERMTIEIARLGDRIGPCRFLMVMM